MFGARYTFLAMMLFGASIAYAQTTKVLPVDFDLRGRGILLQVSEPVPVFTAPDPKSAKLAEADVGTVLLAIGLSNKRTWVEVEDDQGTRGWVPVDRTDLGELLEAQVKMREAEVAATREELTSAAPSDVKFSGATYQSTSQVLHVFGPAIMYGPETSWALLYSLLFQFYIPETGGVRQRAFGGELAWLRNSPSSQYEFRIRYSSKFSSRPKISYGPDAAVRFATAASSTFYAFGYRIGYDILHWLPLELRGAVTTESQARWLGEISLRARF